MVSHDGTRHDNTAISHLSDRHRRAEEVLRANKPTNTRDPETQRRSDTEEVTLRSLVRGVIDALNCHER